MKKILMALFAVLSLALVAEDSEAAQRLGGGKSVGRQRDAVTPQAPANKAPAAAPATPQAQPSGMSKWLGPLAGLAIGAGLASLFMGNGLAGGIAGILMMLLLAAAAVFAWRMWRSRTQPQALQYAGAGNAARQPDISNAFGGGAAAPAAAAVASRFPPGFDAEQFAHHAKQNFTQLQAANDKRDLSIMRDFMTPTLYAEITADLGSRSAAPQQTDVVSLNAEVIEVVTENGVYVASVRFSGMIRENATTPPEQFSEVWHLEKPVSGNTGWLISGIQQD